MAWAYNAAGGVGLVTLKCAVVVSTFVVLWVGVRRAGCVSTRGRRADR